MTIIGFNFSKLYAVHKKPAKGNLKIGTNVKIDALEKTNLIFDNERSAVKATFTFQVKYDPDIGEIELQGDILFMQDKKITDALLVEWQKQKGMPKKLSDVLVNAIMQKCTVQSLIMTRDIGLPPPMPLPRMKPSTMKVKEDKAADKKQ